MSAAQFVDFKHRGRWQLTAGRLGRRNLQCSSARGQATHQQSYLGVIEPLKNNKLNVSERMRLKKKDLIVTKSDKIYGKVTNSDKLFVLSGGGGK